MLCFRLEFARNEQTSESDVDLLIDLEEDTPHIYEVKRSLRNELERQFGRKVEIASERYLIIDPITETRFSAMPSMSIKDRANLLAVLDAIRKIEG